MKNKIGIFLLICFILLFSSNFQKHNVFSLSEDDQLLSELYEGVMPSLGDVNVLVLLIEFPDYLHNDFKHSPQFIKDYLFGPSKVNHESITSFYLKSSLNKLNIQADVLGWYKTKNKSRYYTSNYNDYASDYILKEALNYCFQQGHDFSKYDANNDGYVDAVYAIYSRDYDEYSDTWWAYQTYLDEELTLDNKIISNYMWASVSFVDTDGALTFIHETGHLMGLDDYYDYNLDLGPDGGLGGADLMDDAQGDHGPISKMLLGWIEPIIIETNEYFDVTIDLEPFVDSGQVILICSKFSSIYSEYFLVDFYTPHSLNNTNTYFTEGGVRIYQINAQLGDGGQSGVYDTIFEYDNSDTKYKFASLVEADGRNDILKAKEATNSDLFKEGHLFSRLSIPNNLMNGIKDLQFSLSVLSLDEKKAQIKIISTQEFDMPEVKSVHIILNEILENHYNKTKIIIE